MLAIEHSVLVHRLAPAMLAAGACLLRHRAGSVEVSEKADGSPVTAADREAEDIVTAALSAVMPDVPVIGEEAVSLGHIPAYERRAFLVDALDGTREFVSGGTDFTVNVALVVDGLPVFGLLLAPAAGRLFATLGPAQAGEARVDPARMGEAGPVPEFHAIRTAEPNVGALRVLTSRSHKSAKTDDYLAGLAIGETIGVGSSVKFGLIAAGEADLYPRLGPTSAWDIAAGHAVLAAAGGAVTTLDAHPLRYLERGNDFINPSFVAWGRASLVRAFGA